MVIYTFFPECKYLIDKCASVHGSVPGTREEMPPVSLFLRNTMPWALPIEAIDPLGSTDSFHRGAAKVGAFDTTLTRLFRTAIIELEYVFATSETAAL